MSYLAHLQTLPADCWYTLGTGGAKYFVLQRTIHIYTDPYSDPGQYRPVDLKSIELTIRQLHLLMACIIQDSNSEAILKV